MHFRRETRLRLSASPAVRVPSCPYFSSPFPGVLSVRWIRSWSHRCS